MENHGALFYLHISGLGFDGERRFPELPSGFLTEPSIFFNDDGWISSDIAIVNLNVYEAPFVDANEGPVENGGSLLLDVSEGPFVDANEDPPLNASEGLPVDGNGDDESQSFVDEGQSFVNEGPFVDANEDLTQNGN